MKRINTLAELRAEQKKLLQKRDALKAEIKNDIQDIKADFEPSKLFKNIFMSKNNGILGDSLGSVANYVTKKVLLRKAGFFTNLVVPYLVKNTTSKIVEDNKSKIIGWVTGLFSGFTSDKETAKKEAAV